MSLAVSFTPRHSSSSPGDVTSAPVMSALSDYSYHHTSSVDIYTPRTRSIAVSNGEWWPGADWWLGALLWPHAATIYSIYTIFTIYSIYTIYSGHQLPGRASRRHWDHQHPATMARTMQCTAEGCGDTKKTAARKPIDRDGYCISFFYASSCPMLVRHQPMYFKEDMFIKGNVPKASLYRLPKPRMLLHYHIAQHILCFVRIKQCINAS